MKKNNTAKGVAFSFGRMQPPTTGHELLVNGLIYLAKSGNADHFLFLSQKQNGKTDPLNWHIKKSIVKKSFPSVNLYEKSDIKTPFQALEFLCTKYEDIVFLVGSDRKEEFEERMTPYATKMGIKNFMVMSVADRNMTSTDIDGISGTKLRSYALSGNKEEFYKHLPNQLNKEIKQKVLEYTLAGLEQINECNRSPIIKERQRFKSIA